MQAELDDRDWPRGSPRRSRTDVLHHNGFPITPPSHHMHHTGAGCSILSLGPLWRGI